MYHNACFKVPKAQPPSLRRSPSPPTSYVEPLSPSSVRPRPVEPSFYYPAINNGYQPPTQPKEDGMQRRDDSKSRKRGHHRVSSSIDTLADAALAVTPSFSQSQAGIAAAYGTMHMQHQGLANCEPPHKRARSEAYPMPYTLTTGPRPSTSHHTWGYPVNNFAHGAYETRMEDAALLLNFSATTVRAPAIAHLQHAAQSNTYRPHAYGVPDHNWHSAHAPNIVQQHIMQSHIPPRPALPSPQRTSEGKGSTPDIMSEKSRDGGMIAPEDRDISFPPKMSYEQAQQIQTPPEDFEPPSHNMSGASSTAVALPPKKRGWPKGKPRGPGVKKTSSESTPKPVTKRAAPRKRKSGPSKTTTTRESKSNKEIEPLRRRASYSDIFSGSHRAMLQSVTRSRSVGPDIPMIIRPGPTRSTRKQLKARDVTICGGCHDQRLSAAGSGELDEWISCNGCKQWYHLDCAGFKRAVEVRDVDKYFCPDCESKHGKTTYVRKSTRAHASVDYAELQKGVLKTSEESNEHHYIQPLKDGTFTFDLDQFPRVRPELLTREFFERSGAFCEPICIPAEWNKRPWATSESSPAGQVSTDTTEHEPVEKDGYEYDCVIDDGQDQLDMVMPKGLTVRKVCNLVGPETPLDVIDVKTQNSGAKWNLSKWADYYESNAEDKPIRNVISLEVSQTKLGRLLRRPKVVRDIDLQDHVWPQEETEKGKWPKVQYYCLMSIADSYTDFHIDFGGSSVYYHLIKGKKTFFFIPPRPRHLKTYEEWNDNPQQNFTFLPHITKECYRVDLSEGDTMLIPSGWIHAVWTPETSLVIGGNFLTHMNFKNQFRVAEIEKNNETPLKFRYPFFQRLMWYTAINYMRTDPMPAEVAQLFEEGRQYHRARPIWQDFDQDEENDTPGSANARYYSEAELDGMPELENFIFRTLLMAMGRIEGITADRQKRVHASIPKGHGEPIDIAKAFALWTAWKRGNEDPPAWASPDALLQDEQTPKKLTARAIKDLERKEPFGTSRVWPDQLPKKMHKQNRLASVSSASPAPQTDKIMDATHDATSNFDNQPSNVHTAVSNSSHPSPPMFYSQPAHQDGAFAPAYDFSPPSMAPAMMAMNAFQGQHISTPKTSVLGPKRVACDACRRRRIRCKHKDFVVEVLPETMQQMPNGFDSIGASGDSDSSMISQSFQHDHSDDYTHDDTVNGLVTNGVQHQPIKMEQGTRPINGLGTVPGTNAYVDANIPMTLNGVALFGDPKRGRSKACVECRKSKRRCIHDEQGNVDPIKAAETPVPRASPAVKKRQSEDNLNGESKKTRIDSAVVPQPGVLGVLKPMPYKRQSPTQAEWSTMSPHEHMSRASTGSATPNSHASLPIDPSLTSAYPEPEPYQQMQYSYQAQQRPQLHSLPSLEEIATEVLDMDGGEGQNSEETDLAAIAHFNSMGGMQHTAVASVKNSGYDPNMSGQSTNEENNNTTESQQQVATIEAAEAAVKEESMSSIPVYKPPPSRSPELKRASLKQPPTPRSADKPVASPTASPARPRSQRTRAGSRGGDGFMTEDSLASGLVV